MRGFKMRRDETFRLEHDASRSFNKEITAGPGDFCNICGHWNARLEKVGSARLCKRCKERHNDLAKL